MKKSTITYILNSMAYQALYRKFRPVDFNEVSGQDHIVRTLRNQLNSNRIGHAYVFSGTRGTGKTSVAKIFAKALNCENPDDGNPCGQCASCKAITSGSAINVSEIDAASNNGIEHVRSLIEDVSYPPVMGKKKVYIIDEAHMVTPQAFNALLKTIEEPPEYAVFILATTEVNKIPITIRSRCQRYDFRRITSDVIAARMAHLRNVEGISVEDRALKYIARQADGSMRDALSLFDQCISYYYGKNITYDMVLSMLGAADNELFSDLYRAISEREAKTAVDLVGESINRGMEPESFVSDFTWFLRNLLLVKNGERLEDVADISSENEGVFLEMADSADEEFLMRAITLFSELIQEIRLSPVKRVCLETGIIRLCRPAMDRDYDALVDRIKLLESGAAYIQNPVPVRRDTVAQPKTKDSPAPKLSKTAGETSQERFSEQIEESDEKKAIESEDIQRPMISAVDGDFTDIWQGYLNTIDFAYRASVASGVVIQTGEDSATIYYAKKNSGARLFAKEGNVTRLKEGINKYSKREFKITIKICEAEEIPVAEVKEVSEEETGFFANAKALGVLVETEED